MLFRSFCIGSIFEQMQKLAKTLLKHERLLLNWFESQGLSSGVVEGFNEFETIQIALFHQLGNLPEPESTRRFC